MSAGSRSPVSIGGHVIDPHDVGVCASRAAPRASRHTRSLVVSAASARVVLAGRSGTGAGSSSLTATMRLSAASSAAHTSPMPPRPTGSISRYRPASVTEASAARPCLPITPNPVTRRFDNSRHGALARDRRGRAPLPLGLGGAPPHRGRRGGACATGRSQSVRAPRRRPGEVGCPWPSSTTPAPWKSEASHVSSALTGRPRVGPSARSAVHLRPQRRTLLDSAAHVSIAMSRAGSALALEPTDAVIIRNLSLRALPREVRNLAFEVLPGRMRGPN